jgi:hypothetical protein
MDPISVLARSALVGGLAMCVSSCRTSPVEMTAELGEGSAVVVINRFLSGLNLAESSVVLISDEFMHKRVDDTLFLALDRRYHYQRTSRADVTTDLSLSFGSLLMEPLSPERNDEGIVQYLKFFHRNGPLGQVRYVLVIQGGVLEVAEESLVWIT